MTIKENRKALASYLAPYVGEDEANAMAMDIIEHVKGYSAVDVAINGHRQLLPETEQRMMAIAQRVAKGEPLQYVLGSAHFHGRKFIVSPATLIPRPETSQLVDLITRQWSDRSDLHVLDIGTGSGCIAISLALDLKFPVVDAIDISANALAVAQENAKRLKAKVQFYHADALDLTHWRSRNEPYDIIISNPPYIMECERAQMDSRVVDYEPSEALFVPTERPLLFYQAIALFAKKALSKDGMLYFEINPLQANALKDMLRRIGFGDTQLLADYKGNTRFSISRL